MEAVVTLPEFKYWHVKHQANCPWLTHAHVATIKLVLVLLGNVRSNFYNQEFLKAGDRLPYEKHSRLTRLVNENLDRL